jgi:ATP-dependent DNA helicase RecQ
MSLELLTTLKTHFGHESFRPGQAEIIHQLLAGRNVLGVMPTGAGKSICFQLPALLLPRTVVVISPLIALMKDQVDGLPPAIHARTTLLNSQLEPLDMARRLAGIAA